MGDEAPPGAAPPASPARDHTVRLVAIYATRWRLQNPERPRSARPRRSGVPRLPPMVRRLLVRTPRTSRRRDVAPGADRPPFELGRLTDYWPLLRDKLPRVLEHTELDVEDLSFTAGFDGEISSAESRLFVLPSAVIVATLTFELRDPSFHDDPRLTVSLLERCAYGQIRIAGRELSDWVDDLARRNDCVSARDGVTGLPPERHQIVFARESQAPRSGGAPHGNVVPTPSPLAAAASADVVKPLEDTVIKRILYRIDPPFREGFAPYQEPWGVNRERGTFGAATPYVTLLYGHEDYVQNNVFLTTVQAVGTETRFRQIWYEAYGLVRDFREHMQAQEVGLQKRADLEDLVDALGNLELDLSFSVETSADLGLLIPSLRIESFHRALYAVMELHTRAQTVSQMFRRLDGSIQSEITAIEIRERRSDEARRVSGGFATSLISTVAVPIGFLVAFFGINATEVSNSYSIFDWGHYRWAYVAAGLLALIPIVAFVALYGKALLDIRSRNRQRAAREQRRLSDEAVGGTG
jgi:hypothetical protein